MKIIFIAMLLLFTPPSFAKRSSDDCAGLEGKLYGLCNAYCVALECEDGPMASTKACERLTANFIAAAGELPPCVDSEPPPPPPTAVCGVEEANDPIYHDRFEGTGFQNGCMTDADCIVGGCSGEVCAAEPVFTTCEVLPESPPGSGIPVPGEGCLCVNNQCLWQGSCP